MSESTLLDTYKMETFKCEICPRKFIKKHNFSMHQILHTVGKPHKCSFCHIEFESNSDLIRHERTHTGERPYECSFCEKKFTLKGNMVKHERIHTGERPYECSICKKKFNTRGNLVSHHRIHTGENPYECAVCQKKFKSKSDILIHTRSHTGEQPYKCSFCQKRTSSRSNLTRHISQVHTGEKSLLTLHEKLHSDERHTITEKVCIKEEVLDQDSEIVSNCEDHDDIKNIFENMQTPMDNITLKSECKIEIDHHELLLEDVKQFKGKLKNEEEH